MSRGPGRWQRIILDLLEDREAFPLSKTVAHEVLKKPLTDAEYSALQRAAHLLRDGGRLQLALAWGKTYDGKRRTAVRWVARPDVALDEYEGLNVMTCYGDWGK